MSHLCFISTSAALRLSTSAPGNNYLARAHPLTSWLGTCSARPGLCLLSALSRQRTSSSPPSQLGLCWGGGGGPADLSRHLQREKSLPEPSHPGAGQRRRKKGRRVGRERREARETGQEEGWRRSGGGPVGGGRGRTRNGDRWRPGRQGAAWIPASGLLAAADAPTQPGSLRAADVQGSPWRDFSQISRAGQGCPELTNLGVDEEGQGTPPPPSLPPRLHFGGLQEASKEQGIGSRP